MDQATSAAPAAPPPSARRGVAAWLPGAALALASLAWMAQAGALLTGSLSVTRDEPGHLSAGLAGWRGGDYRQTTGNLFFAQKWAAWPLLGRGLPPPDPEVGRAVQWDPLLLGEALLFSGQSDPRAVLAPARRMTLALCVLSGVLVWGWASWLAGPWAGGLAALLYATCPVVLANGVLVTTDTAAAFWYVAALASYAWLLRRPAAPAAALTGLCAGMLLLSKFTIVAWVCGAALLLAWHLGRQRGRGPVLALAGWHVGACAVAGIAVWAFFGFDFRPGGFTYLGPQSPGILGRAVALLGRCHALPEPYLREVLKLADMMKPRPAYLLGRFRVGGFWDYFPVAFLAKSTVAMLLALLAGLFARPARPAGPGAIGAAAPLAAGALGYAAVSMAAPLNIGVRHILPLFLLAAIAGGVALARLARRGRLARALAGGVALLAAGEGLSARRQPLAWFNALAGGPMSGYRIMVDSSLEWGGDLGDLIAWERGLRTADPAAPLFVCLLGPPAHEHFGLPAVNLEWAFENGRVRPGYFVFGATRLVGGPAELFGEWGEPLRREWAAEGAPAWRGPLTHRLVELAVARLAASCRRMTPMRIGPVYFAYHLDEGALERALGSDADGLSGAGPRQPPPAALASPAP